MGCDEAKRENQWDYRCNLMRSEMELDEVKKCDAMGLKLGPNEVKHGNQ